MTDLVPYRAAPIVAPATDTDSWVSVVADIARLAQEIANTDFVPDAMRGKPAAVTAAILAGREMGIGPMTSLQHIHVIKGKPGQSAHLMRGLVLAAGHEMDPIEVTDSRAVVRGRRAGETDWVLVEFTAAQARTAKIDLGGYPADKLYARASARLCRRKFADVILGLAYTVEELQDGDAQLIDAGESPAALPAGEEAPAAPQRTAQRKSSTRAKTSAPARGGAAAAPAVVDPGSSGPPLPGEAGYDEPAPDDAAPPNPTNTLSSAEQNKLMHALFREADVTDRDERLKLTGLLLGRPLDTSKGLTVADASGIIDALVNLQNAGHKGGLAGAVNDLLNEQALAEAEQEAADETAAAES
jgi:hypothetical protein